MRPEIMARFKILFEIQKDKLIYSKTILNEDFNIKAEDRIDDSDMSSSELENNMRVRLRNREALYIKKIEEALQRIADGSFGKCQTCEEEIEPKRLEARPTATLCVHCKEQEERAETLHIDGHRSKSLGYKSFRMA
ncbi:MAG: TraR/DksA C4-type zinc finger protein [Bdellovibrionota bacterium]